MARQRSIDPAKITTVAAAEAEVLAERRAMAERIIAWPNSPAQWRADTRKITARVKHIRDSVNRRRREAFDSSKAAGGRARSHPGERLVAGDG